MVGTTARLDALQATVLRHKLRRLDDWNDERRTLGAALRQRMELAGTTAIDPVRPPFIGADRVYHLFVVRTDAREELRDHLSEWGVASAIHYPTPIHLTEAYAHLGLGPGSLPVSERLARQICSLPLFPGMTDAESEHVSAAVLAFTQDQASGPR